jgi:DNA-binding transcriptional MerR regulator
MGNGDEGFSFKNWYAEHGGRLNKDRRKRYRDDPDYRKRVLAMNRTSRERRRKEQAEQRRAEREASKLKPRPLPFKTVEATVTTEDGEEVQAKLFTIGALARTVGCSVQAIRLWEKQGVLPPTELRNSKGDRLYTAQQVEMIYELMKQQGRLNEAEGNEPRKREKPKPFMRDVRFPNGRVENLPLFRIGVLAQAIGRTVLTVEQMEQRGALPPTPFRAASTRYRLYTGEMIEAVAQAMDARGGSIRGKERWRSFHDDILKEWKSLGVMGASLAS